MLILLFAACYIDEGPADTSNPDVPDDEDEPGCAVFAKPELDFGAVPVGVPSVMEVNVRNDCSGTLEIEKLAVTAQSGFTASLIGAPVLEMGEKTLLSVGFSPWSGDSYHGELWIEGSTVAVSERLSLSGVGDAPRITVDTNTVTFSGITPGCPTSAVVGIHNMGHADLIVDALEYNGAGLVATGVSAGTVIPKGASATITVQWTAGVADLVGGQVRILTDDPFQPEVDIAVDGTVSTSASRNELFIADPKPVDLVFAAQGDAIETNLDATIRTIGETLDSQRVDWRGYVVSISSSWQYNKRGWREKWSDLVSDTKSLEPSTSTSGWLLAALTSFANQEKPGENDAIVSTIFAVDRDQNPTSYLDMYDRAVNTDYALFGAESSSCGKLSDAKQLRTALKAKSATLVDACGDWDPSAEAIAYDLLGESVGFRLADVALSGVTATVNGLGADAELLPDGRTVIVPGANKGSKVVITYVPVPDTCP